MKTAEQSISRIEERKNVITFSMAGASIGVLYAYGFDFGFEVGIIGGALLGAAIAFRTSRRPPKMRYPMMLLRRMFIAAAVLSLTSFGYTYLLDQDLSQSQRFWAAIFPTLGWTALIISIGMIINSLDELQHHIQTEAIAIAFAGTWIFVGGYALFQFAGLTEVNIGIVIFIMSPMWLLGKLWTRWKYR